MKPFNLEIILKKSHHLYKKPNPKTITLLTRIPAGAATKQPPLGSILGTSGLNAESFCQKFNLMTSNYTSPIILPVKIKIEFNKQYEIKTKSPTFYILVQKYKKKLLKLKKQKKKKQFYLCFLIILYKILIIKNSKNYRQLIDGSKSWNLFKKGKKKSSNSSSYFYRKKKKK